MSYDDLIEQQMGTTVEKFEKQVTKAAKSSVKQTLVTKAIADKENIKLDDETYKTELKKDCGCIRIRQCEGSEESRIQVRTERDRTE